MCDLLVFKLSEKRKRGFIMLTLAGVNFGTVFCATGARGFYGEGYPFHKYWRYAGMDWRDTAFSGKTLTLPPRAGNMPLENDGVTPREFIPRCIWARFTREGEMFNAVGLSNFGAEFYLATGMYHRINTPFFISFMPMAEDPSGRVAETTDFCKLLARYLPFNAPFAVQLNVVCPNTGHDVSALQQEMAHLVTVMKVHLPGIPIVLNVNALVPPAVLIEAARIADGLWVGNTIPYGATDRIDWSSYGPISPIRKRLDPKGLRPKDKIDGGLSSPKCLPLTVELVSTLRDSGVSIPIVGGNGVRTLEHVADLVSAGCDATFIGSLAVVRPNHMRTVVSFANHAFNSRHRSRWPVIHHVVPSDSSGDGFVVFSIPGVCSGEKDFFIHQEGETPMAMPVKKTTIIRPDDWHLHLRNGRMLSGFNQHSGTVGWSMAGRFRRALVMPNLAAPVVNAELAGLYRGEILAAADLFRQNYPGFRDDAFDPIMTLYLTNDTTTADIEAAAKTGFIRAAKLYPANATTNSSHGVTDIDKMGPVFEAMREVGMKLCIHGEALQHADGGEVDVFKRETVFLLETLYKLVDSYPGLEIVLEHITTADAVTFVLDAPETVHATITAHHLVGNRNWLFRSADGSKSGLQPEHYCLPVFKKENDREYLVMAATSGDPRFFLGTDSAPHSSDNKYKSCGCAGCLTAPHALLICADVFERAGALDQLEAFVSVNGARAYGLPLNTERLTLERTPFVVPERLAFSDAWSGSVDGATTVVPFLAGMELPWSFQDAHLS